MGSLDFARFIWEKRVKQTNVKRRLHLSNALIDSIWVSFNKVPFHFAKLAPPELSVSPNWSPVAKYGGKAQTEKSMATGCSLHSRSANLSRCAIPGRIHC